MTTAAKKYNVNFINQKHKRTAPILLCLFVFFLPFMLGACQSQTQIDLISSQDSENSTGDRTKELVVFNYGDYIDKRVLKLFEAETGIKVKYEQYVTPEDMYTKFQSGAIPYDVICSSDYIIEKMIRSGETLPLDINSMEHYKNIDPKYLKFCESFDPGNRYSIPYFWGTVGILYNTAMVDQPVTSWNILWNETYRHKIIMENSMRDAFLVPLKLKGHSLNTTNLDELKAAQTELIRQKPLVMAYMVDEAKDAILAGDAVMAVIYSGDATIAMDYSKELAYCVPEEGSNIWFDSLVIPSTAKNKKEAELFIDFLCREDISRLNFEYIYYGTPNKAVYDSLDKETQEDPVIFPSDETLKKCEVYKYLGPEMEDIYNTLWKELKAH